MASMPEPVVDRSDRARRPTERLTRTPVSSVTPPAGSDASATGTLTPEVEGKLHDAVEVCPACGQKDEGQQGEYPCPTCGLPTTHDTPDDSSDGDNVGCGT